MTKNPSNSTIWGSFVDFKEHPLCSHLSLPVHCFTQCPFLLAFPVSFACFPDRARVLDSGFNLFGIWLNSWYCTISVVSVCICDVLFLAVCEAVQITNICVGPHWCLKGTASLQWGATCGGGTETGEYVCFRCPHTLELQSWKCPEVLFLFFL